jgi:hypothetical protein
VRLQPIPLVHPIVVELVVMVSINTSIKYAAVLQLCLIAGFAALYLQNDTIFPYEVILLGPVLLIFLANLVWLPFIVIRGIRDRAHDWWCLAASTVILLTPIILWRILDRIAI